MNFFQLVFQYINFIFEFSAFIIYSFFFFAEFYILGFKLNYFAISFSNFFLYFFDLSIFITFLNSWKLLEYRSEIMVVCFSLVVDDFFELFNILDLFLTFGLNLINNFLNFLLDGSFSVFGDIFFRIMVIMIFKTIKTKKVSIQLAMSV